MKGSSKQERGPGDAMTTVELNTSLAVEEPLPATDHARLGWDPVLLGTISSSALVLGRRLEILYANASMQQLLVQYAEKFQQRRPMFEVESLLRSSLEDLLPLSSELTAAAKGSLEMPRIVELSVDSAKFRLTWSRLSTIGQPEQHLLEWVDLTDQFACASETARLRQAIHSASVPLMMVDRDLAIVYVNEATSRLMKTNEPVLAQVFPGFKAEALIGTNIDVFHVRPEHQRRLLSDPKNLPHTAKIRVGPLTFRLHVTAIVSTEGDYIGNTLEWNDITAQEAAEAEIERILPAIVDGRFDQRVALTVNDGFIGVIARGLNSILDSLSAPLREVTSSVQALAEGDLSATIQSNYAGEYGLLVGSLNSSVVNLRDMVTHLREASVAIAQAATELNHGNTSLSTRTQEQAAALEETAATVAEMTETVKKNADNAREASQLAGGAREVAERGGQVVTQAVGSMSEIRESSRRIADIISVIDDIAFQTNLLALNAAVEAARAGDQGRGFAVVATEVRSLAQRSAAAAKEIKALIKDSVDRIDHGTRLVDQSGDTLLEIIGSVKQVSKMVGEIAVASDEQAIGIEQVNKAINQMDEATQQNAALVEESAAAAASLDDQAAELTRHMEGFRLGETTSDASGAAPPVAAKVELASASKARTRERRPTAEARPIADVRPSLAKSGDSDDEEWESF